MGIASSLIAASIGWYVKGPYTGAVFGIAGLALWLVAHFFFPKKSDEHSPQPIHIETAPNISPNISPTITVSPTIHIAPSAAVAPAPDHAYGEVLAFLERTSQRGRAVTYFVENIAAATGLAEPEVARVLQRLFSEEHVYRSEIQGVGTDGGFTRWGFVYWYAHF